MVATASGPIPSFFAAAFRCFNRLGSARFIASITGMPCSMSGTTLINAAMIGPHGGGMKRARSTSPVRFMLVILFRRQRLRGNAEIKERAEDHDRGRSNDTDH